MKTVIVTALLASLALTTIAQAQTYTWEEGHCSYKGDFDSTKYSAKQIKNVHLVMESLTRTNLDSFFSPMNIEALDNLSMHNLDKLTKEYHHIKRNAENLEVVPEAMRYQQQLLKAIDDEYRTDKLTILAYLNPSEALKQSPKMCKNYIEPFLQNETAVQNRWQQFVADNIKEQAAITDDGGQHYRSLATERYQREKASNPAKYAKIDLVTFGFSNCVNNQGYHADPDDVLKGFKKLNKILFGNSLKQRCFE